MTEKQDERIKMLDEYDFSNGIRGKYANLIARKSKVVVPEPDVAEILQDFESVNEALRALLPIIQKQRQRTHK